MQCKRQRVMGCGTADELRSEFYIALEGGKSTAVN